MKRSPRIEIQVLATSTHYLFHVLSPSALGGTDSKYLAEIVHALAYVLTDEITVRTGPAMSIRDIGMTEWLFVLVNEDGQSRVSFMTVPESTVSVKEALLTFVARLRAHGETEGTTVYCNESYSMTRSL